MGIFIFVTESPKVTNQELVEKENDVTLVAIKGKVLPLTTSPQQGYFSFQYNNDPIDDTNNTPIDSINAESYYNTMDGAYDDLFNASIDNGDDGYLDNTCDDKDGVYNKGLVNDWEELTHFQNEHQLPQS